MIWELEYNEFDAQGNGPKRKVVHVEADYVTLEHRGVVFWNKEDKSSCRNKLVALYKIKRVIKLVVKKPMWGFSDSI